MSAAATTVIVATTPVVYDITLVSPWFSATSTGLKRWEGRLCTLKYASIRVDDYLRVTHATQPQNTHYFIVRVKEVRKFNSFEEGLRSCVLTSPSSSSAASTSADDAASMADADSTRTASPMLFSEVLPGVTSIENGVAIYRSFYSDALQSQHGVVFFHTELVPTITWLSSLRFVVPAVIRGLSLWIQMESQTQQYKQIQSAIDKLSNRYASNHSFEPHVTLVSLPWPSVFSLTLQQLVEGVQKAIDVTQQYCSNADSHSNGRIDLFSGAVSHSSY